MKKYILSFSIVFLLALVLSTCASVKSQGINYFIGRSESDLINHFGYNGVEIDSVDSDYDKILFFSNKRLRYRMNKTNIVRYKVSRQTEIMIFSFYEFADGCLTDPNSAYYGMHIGIEGVAPNYSTVHRNDNSIIGPRVNEFNNIINRNISFPTSQRNQVFNNSNIGDTYYLYEKNIRQNWSSGVTGLTQGEAYTSNTWGLWRINIVSEDRPETESWIVAIYDERLDRWLSGNGNTTITQERANNIINEYLNNGFTRSVVSEGHSMYAYIENGKVVRVEEK